jgi:glycosyltransferase involved in cell wall biosynthesis
MGINAEEEALKEPRGRHCMVVHAYYPAAETRVERQARALLDHGIDVDLICLQKPGEPATANVDGVQVYRLPVRRHKGKGMAIQMLEYLAFFFLAFIRLTALDRRRRYEIVQVHNLPDFLVFVALIPKWTGARVILDMHDLMPEFYAERFERPMNSFPLRLVRWQEWVSCRFADHLITVTELWRQALIDRGQPSDKITVVMNVADDRIFHRDGVWNAPCRRHGSLQIIYHGTMARRYGLDIALRAVALARRTNPEIFLTLHGRGEYSQTLQNLALELGLQDHVKFSMQFMNTNDLANLILQADLGIVPYRDGVFTGDILPTKLMEYAALGIPCIAAHTRAIAAHFTGAAVHFFTPGDMEDLARSILALARDREKLAALARNLGEFTQRYNWPDQGAIYIRLVRRMAGRNNRVN